MSVIEDRCRWDRRIGRHFYSSAAWLAFCAADYGLSVDGVVGRARGAEVAVPVVDGIDPAGTPYAWNEALAARGLPLLPGRGLMVGPREGYQTRLLSEDPEPDPAAVADLVAALRSRAGAGQACVAVYLDGDGVRALRAAGVTAPAVLLEPDAWIEVPEGGFDAWLAARPRGRRSTIRRELREFAASGLTVEHRDLGSCLDEVVPLAVATLSKYRAEPVDPGEERAALANHTAHLGEAARVALCRLDGDAVGFSLYYRRSDTHFVRWVGFDYDRLPGVAEYFNLVFYDPVRRAEQEGIRWVHAGLSTLAAKVGRGAGLRPLYLVDLAEDSPLSTADAAAAVRAANQRIHRGLVEDPALAGGVVESAWAEPR